MVTNGKEFAIINSSANSEIIGANQGVTAERKYNTHQNDHRPVSFLLENEVNALVDAAATMRDGRRNALMIQLLFQCCLRISECLQLTKNKRIYIQGKPVFTIIGKGNKPRLVPVPEALSDKFGKVV